MSGDGVAQNFPLRVLAGVDLRHGHLPLWDPYIWSGTPLLAGFNAGAFYPVTFLFAFLPPTIAWSIAEASVFIVPGLGLYLFLRLYKLPPIAAAAGALSWCGFGFMGAQLVHIASVQGWGWVCWMLVALQRIAAGPRGHRARWAALLGLALGLVLLVGDPESITEGSMMAAIYLAHLLWKYRDPSLLVWAIAGSAGGVAVGAAQWLPGFALAQASQRGHAAYWFFTAGSVEPSNLPLLAVPFLDGGYGRLGVPYYFGNYALEELSGYVGVVALAAVFSLPLLWRRDPRARDWRIWYLTGAIGLVLAMGGSTPVAHLMYHVPLYRLLRLPSRNLAWVDLSASILAGFWVERVLMARLVGAGSSSGPSASVTVIASARSGPGVSTAALRWCAGVPAGLLAGSLVVLLVDGTGVISALTDSSQAVSGYHRVALIVTTGVQGLIAGFFFWVVFRSPRLARRRAVLLLLGALTADLLFYDVNQQWLAAPNERSVTAQTMDSRALAADLGAAGGGRFAIYDPDRYHIAELVKFGEPDINLNSRTPSVQGYGSIEPGTYADATGTHQELSLSTPALSDGTFASLGLSVLVSPRQYFSVLTSQPPLTVRQRGFRLAYPLPPAPANAPASLPAAGTVGAGRISSWFWGQEDVATSVTVTLASQVPALGGGGSGVQPFSQAPESGGGTPGFQIGLVQVGGSIDWQEKAQLVVARKASTYELRAARDHPMVGVGVAIRPTGSSAVRVKGVSYQDVKGFGYRLSGALTGAIRPGVWVYADTIGDYAVYVDRAAARADHLVSPSDGSVKVFPAEPWGTQAYLVEAHLATTMVRSVSYLAGWRATLVPANGSVHRVAVTEQVSRHGLVQSIPVPAGTWLVTFTYHPPKVAEGLLIALAGMAALVLMVLAGSRRRLVRVGRL